MSKLIVKDLDKIFGPEPKKIVPMIKKGMSKSDILKKTGHTVGVYNANFEVKDGEFFVIMGLSGSGKSTLVRCLNRLIEPSSGKIMLEGEDVVSCNKEKLLEVRRKKVSMVFQRFGLLPHRTIIQNVEYGLEVQGVEPKEREKKAKDAINLVGLNGYEDSYPDQLSGGMQQRVGLARALANDPEILLMDEAFSALDPLIRKEMQDELLDLQDRMHKTIIFITHDLDEALKLGDRIAIMKDGSIVQIGTPEEILTNPANAYVSDFVQDVNRAKVITASSVMRKPDSVIVEKDGPRVAAHKLKEHGHSSIFVTDAHKRLKGIVKVEDAMELVHEGTKELDNIIIEDIQTTSPDTYLEDLFPMSANMKYPIAVIDENKKLLGIVIRSDIITGMVREGDEIV
ncbi:MAG: glycine betaine/L-proline ABC transporter ATP-binding protein [Eubacteriales bacterium]